MAETTVLKSTKIFRTAVHLAFRARYRRRPLAVGDVDLLLLVPFRGCDQRALLAFRGDLRLKFPLPWLY
jgi:hypothetical protein